MKRFKKESAALEVVREDGGGYYGMSVIDGMTYVGSIAELRGVGVPASYIHGYDLPDELDDEPDHTGNFEDDALDDDRDQESPFEYSEGYDFSNYDFDPDWR